MSSSKEHKVLLSKADWVKTLPSKVIGAHGLIFNSKKELLLVKPHYRKYWTLPGGIVEAEESPSVACIREIQEEIGIECKITSILCCDYFSDSVDEPEYLVFYYQITSLSEQEIEKINIDGTEIVDFGFYNLETVNMMTNECICKRIKQSMKNIDKVNQTYLENGSLIGLQ